MAKPLLQEVISCERFFYLSFPRSLRILFILGRTLQKGSLESGIERELTVSPKDLWTSSPTNDCHQRILVSLSIENQKLLISFPLAGSLLIGIVWLLIYCQPFCYIFKGIDGWQVTASQRIDDSAIKGLTLVVMLFSFNWLSLLV